MDVQSNVERFDNWMKHTVRSNWYANTPVMTEAYRKVALHQIISQKYKLKKQVK